MNKNAFITERKRAEDIRNEAMEGNTTAQELSSKYGLSLTSIYKILQQARCKTGGEPINARRFRTIRRGATVLIYKRLGFSYSTISKVMKLCPSCVAGLGLKALRGELPTRDDITIKIKVVETTGKVPVGNFELIPLDNEKVLLSSMGDSELPIKTTYQELLGKVSPYEPEANTNK